MQRSDRFSGLPTWTGLPIRAFVPALVLLAQALLNPASVGAQVLLVSPVIDHSDRVEEILENAEPAIAVRRVRINGEPRRPDRWRRAVGESQPVDLRESRMVILESAPLSALSEIAAPPYENLVEALGPWIEKGGHLLIVGGMPSYETYRGSELAKHLPARPSGSESAGEYTGRLSRPLSGQGSEGTSIWHLHPVKEVRGEVLIRAGGQPFAITSSREGGRVTLVLGGSQTGLMPLDGPADDDFFASGAWDRFLLSRVGEALGGIFEPGPRPDPSMHALPAVRRGARVDPTYWFGQRHVGRLALIGPWGGEAYSTRVWKKSRPTLPRTLRPGRYEALLETGDRVLRRSIEVGAAVDQAGFDIRLWHLSNVPYPIGYARGEAYRRSREVAAVGVTSVVMNASHQSNTIRDMPAIREILQAGLNLVYYHSFRLTTFFPNRWPGRGPAPPVATDVEGRATGWDIHSDAYRNRIDHVYDGFEEVLSLPRIRAVHLFEENRDGALRSPSLADEMKSHGLHGNEMPATTDWLAYEDLRSRETRTTYLRFRSLARRILPGIPVATYWPGSYWRYPQAYGHRVPDFAASVDEFLGPAYGYEYGMARGGWLSAVRSTSEIFSAFDYDQSGERGIGVYIQGTPITPTGGRALDLDVWRESGWTALATGANQLAYYHMPFGETLAPLAPLHDRWHRVGPWLSSAPRRVAPIAVLRSWSSRTGSSDEQTGRHHQCTHQLFYRLVLAFEEVDYLGEEQLDRIPDETRAIFVSRAPILSHESVEGLVRFVERGGVLFVDPASAKLDTKLVPRSDPWHAIRGTGRVRDLDEIGQNCGSTAHLREPEMDWRRILAGQSIQPVSDTLNPDTQARLLGDGEVRYWVFLNHQAAAQKLHATARLDAAGWLWRDLESMERVRPGANGSAMRASVAVGPYDAVVWGGTRRPSALLEIEAQVEWHEVTVSVRALDDRGRAVPDHTPLRLDIRDASGREVLTHGLHSRTIRGGKATWTVPIPAADPGGRWKLEVEAPLSGLHAITEAEVQAPTATISPAPKRQSANGGSGISSVASSSMAVHP